MLRKKSTISLNVSAKLLLDQPIEKENSFHRLLEAPHTKTKLVTQNRKYDPTFQRTDIETLIEQNKLLKQQSLQDRQTIVTMKFKIDNQEKKIRSLEAAQLKYQGITEDKLQNIPVTVYTNILKNKIKELSNQKTEAEAQIRELKRLPNASIFEENSIEKMQLLNQTVRLKAIITSLSSKQEENLPNQFLRLIKEENQKLKATIRVLQNDKHLMKSRQSIHNKLANDLKRDIEHLRQKLAFKDADLQKYQSENKNLLFKKASQFKIEQDKRDSQELIRLKKKSQSLEAQLKRVESQRDIFLEDNQALKEKEKKRSDEFMELQLRSESERKTSLDKIQLLQNEILHLRSDLANQSTKITKKKKPELKPIVKTIFNKAVEICQMELAALKLNSMQPSVLQSLFQQKEEYRGGELISIFRESLQFPKELSVKLARYVVQDNKASRIEYDENTVASKQICLDILRTLIRRVKDADNPMNTSRLKLIFGKSKKFTTELEGMRGKSISKDQLTALLLHLVKERMEPQQIWLLITKGFQENNSQEEIILNVDAVLNYLEVIQK